MPQLKYRSLADELRRRVESMAEGSRLPSLRALRQRTGYSVQTINAAVTVLEQEGLLIRKHGSGLYVAPKDGIRHIAFCRSTFPSIIQQIKEQGLIRACARRGWILTPHQFPFDRPDLLDHEVRGDAIVVSPEILTFGYSIAHSLIEAKVPLVVLGPNNGPKATDSVNGDNLAALSLILKKLVSLGHRRIAYLNTEPANPDMDQRLAQFRSLTTVLDLDDCPVVDCHTQSGQSNADFAAKAMDQYLNRHPKRLPFTALVSCSCPGSYAAMRALHEHGWRIPKDCSVICMQDDPVAPYFTPALTNLKWDYPSWGEQCIALIESRFNGEISTEAHTVNIVPEINWRESAGKAPR